VQNSIPTVCEEQNYLFIYLFEFIYHQIVTFKNFLHKIQLLILKVSSKGKRLILCCGLNVNFIQYSGKPPDLQNLLLMNNLITVEKSPTRISNHSTSFIDVIIVNNIKNELFTVKLELGYSDHLAQILCIK
jgi:hypothetical protein